LAEERQQGDGGRQLFCRIITPEKMVYDGEANLVVARIREGEKLHVFATSDGFFKVSENLVQILVEEAVEAGEIDVDAAGDQVEEAERELSEVGEDAEDRDRVMAEIDRKRRMGENLMRVAGKYGQG
jgi:F-type H+-transporting ATPase subunit epsilon